MNSPEAIGAVPQPAINPLSHGQPPPPQQGQGIPQLPPGIVNGFRKDPEIIQAISKFVGQPMDLSKVPDQLITVVAGMVQKLGVDGAVAEFQKIVPPQIQQQLRAGAAGAGQAPGISAQPMPPRPSGVTAVRG